MTGIPTGRLFPRKEMELPCQVAWRENQIPGTTKNISYNGIAVSLPTAPPLGTQEPVRISLQESIHLTVLPVHTQPRQGGFVVGFKIARIESGEEKWNQLNFDPEW